MKLSEAIRLGSMLKPQGFGFYQTLGGSCAYGAAMDACGVAEAIQNTITDSAVMALFPIGNRRACCPVCTPAMRAQFDPVHDVDDVVPHLNDDHRWTREQIAAWVELQEQAHEGVPAASEAAQELQPC